MLLKTFRVYTAKQNLNLLEINIVFLKDGTIQKTYLKGKSCFDSLMSFCVSVIETSVLISNLLYLWHFVTSEDRTRKKLRSYA